ncbi:MAG: shikimate kinase [Tateyamaria sp.]|jgi:shikimate kinase|nr:shikimate kinase [Tateyamaria sp.]MBT5300704.1 shikimate kinase [Tateyamaria sp.]MBT7448780.1 shikimate kinase [Tateyamaria sp.]MBT7801106.1 shikimate kinase [Tateyamaria sp.]
MGKKKHIQPHFILKKTIVMVGMMGAGKTAVGRGLSQRLSVPFLDSDSEIETAANRTVPEIFKRDGEKFFRAREAEVIARLLEEKRGVLSTGGGAFLAQDNRIQITTRGVSVWLDADLDLLWHRVRLKDTRPLLRTADPFATLTKIYGNRVPTYAKADVVVKSISGLSIEEMVDRVIDKLLSDRPDVLEMSIA